MNHRRFVFTAVVTKCAPLCFVFVVTASLFGQSGSGVITTVAGDGSLDYKMGRPATQSGLCSADSLALDPAGDIFFTGSDCFRPGQSVQSGKRGSSPYSNLFIISKKTGKAELFSGDWCQNLFLPNNRECAGESMLVGDLGRPNGSLYAVQGGYLVRVPFDTMAPEILPFDGEGTMGLVNVFAKDGHDNFYFVSGDCPDCLWENQGGDGISTKIAITQWLGSPKPDLIRQDWLVADQGGNLYLAGRPFIQGEYGDTRIWRIDPRNGSVVAYAGSGKRDHGGEGGPAVDAGILHIGGMAIDLKGNLYFSDGYYNCVRKVDAATGIITIIAGTGRSTDDGGAGFAGDGGPPGRAKLNEPRGLAVDGQGNLYIYDSGNHRIRKIDWSASPAPNGALTAPLGAPASQPVPRPLVSNTVTPTQSAYRVTVEGKGLGKGEGGQPYALITNQSPAPLTAVKFTDSSLYGGTSTHYYDVRLIHRPPVPPGQFIGTPLRSVGYGMYAPETKFLAAVFADGTTIGNPEDVNELISRRRVIWGMFQNILPVLCEAQERGSARQELLGILQQHHDRWMAMPDSAPKADLLKEEAYRFVVSSLSDAPAVGNHSTASDAITAGVKAVRSFAADLASDPVKGINGEAALNFGPGSFACTVTQ